MMRMQLRRSSSSSSSCRCQPNVSVVSTKSRGRIQHHSMQVQTMSEDQESVTKPVRFSGVPSRKIWRPTPETASKLPWLTELNAFCSEASVVGLRYVANPSASVFRRSVWVLLLLAGAAFTTYQILDRIKYYFSYPTNVNVRVEHVPEMRFPSVTFCNENVITLSGATALGNITACAIATSCCISDVPSQWESQNFDPQIPHFSTDFNETQNQERYPEKDLTYKIWLMWDNGKGVCVGRAFFVTEDRSRPFMAQNACFRVRQGLLGVSMLKNNVWRSKLPQNMIFGGLNRYFKPNLQNFRIAISRKVRTRSKRNLK